MQHLLRIPEGVRVNHDIQVSCRSNNNRHLEPQLFLYLLRNRSAQPLRDLIRGAENNIATLDIGRNIRTTNTRKNLRKHLHRQHVLATNVDPSKQRNMSRNSLRHSTLPRKPVLLNWSHAPRK